MSDTGCVGPSLSPQTHRMRKHAVLALTESGRVTVVCPSRPGLGRRKRPALSSARRLSCSPGVTLRPLCPLSDTPASNLTIYLKTKQQPSRGDSLMPSASRPSPVLVLVSKAGPSTRLWVSTASPSPELYTVTDASPSPMCLSLTHFKKKKKRTSRDPTAFFSCCPSASSSGTSLKKQPLHSHLHFLTSHSQPTSASTSGPLVHGNSSP